MKVKYLLSAMLGGAMLTACSVEDDLNTALVGQETESTAPVFTVHLDGDNDPFTRSVWKDLNQGFKVNFVKGDQMSLFHGVSVDETNKTLTKFENAVYLADGGDGEGLTFSTAAMVTKGDAIMIWPADTAFVNRGAKKIQIRISGEQDSDTKKNTPYMSDILDIKAYGDYNGYQDEKKTIPNSKVTEGYGRNYDISLKRVASQLGLALKYENTDKINSATVDGVAVPETHTSKVEINSGDEKNKVFTTMIDVVKSDEAPVKKDAPVTWSKQSELDLNSAMGVQAIITEDVEMKAIHDTQKLDNDTEKDVATFTLLPKAETVKISEKTGVITVYTTYGKVELKADAKVWKNPQYKKDSKEEAEKDEYLNVTEGLNRTLANLWTPTSTTTSDFYRLTDKKLTGENQGGYFPRVAKVDMSTLDMDGLHIKNKETLRAALAVYRKIAPKGKVTFILDGNNGDADNTFLMDKKTWEDVVDQLDKKNTKDNYVEFALCTKGGKETCDVVRLDSGSSEEEVPELRFAGDKKAIVQLVGKWTYAGVNDITKSSEANTKDDKRKNLSGIETIVVNSGATLTLTEGDIVARTDVKFENKGTIVAEGRVVLKESMTNSGTIKIGSETETTDRLALSKKFGATKGAVLTNNAGSKATDKGGQILNGGTLAIVDNSTATINNYGTIELLNGEARTLISSNAAGVIGKGFNASSNKIGSIILKEKTGGDYNTKVLNPGEQGFIKFEVTADEVNSDLVGTVANYIIINGGTKVASTTGKSLPKSVEYIEIKSTKEVKFGSKDVNQKPTWGTKDDERLKAIIINDGASINIPETVNLYVEVLYVPKGTVVKAGNFSYKQLTGYYGGADTDEKNIFTF